MKSGNFVSLVKNELDEHFNCRKNDERDKRVLMDMGRAVVVSGVPSSILVTVKIVEQEARPSTVNMVRSQLLADDIHQAILLQAFDHRRQVGQLLALLDLGLGKAAGLNAAFN